MRRRRTILSPCLPLSLSPCLCPRSSSALLVSLSVVAVCANCVEPAGFAENGDSRIAALVDIDVMDPRDMINEVRSDFESNRWTAFVLAGILLLGLAAWCHALWARTAVRRVSVDRSQISVLSDPFADQH